MELLEVGDNAGGQAVTGEDDNDDAYDAVDEPHGADVEVGAHLVDKESDDRPPNQCSKHYGQVTEDNVVELIFRQGKAETCEQGDNQEHDERVAQGEKETRDSIAPAVVTLVQILLNLAYRVMENHVKGIDNQDDTAHNLQEIDMVSDEISDQ